MSLRVDSPTIRRERVTRNEKLPEDYYAEFDEEETIDAIATALGKGDCRVAKIEADKKDTGDSCGCGQTSFSILQRGYTARAGVPDTRHARAAQDTLHWNQGPQP